MIKRTAGAAIRALLVAWLLVMPALLLPVAADTAQMVAFLAIAAAVLTFVEYLGAMPSMLEFRHAPPFNRIRFALLYFTIFALTQITRFPVDPGGLTGLTADLGLAAGRLLDVPFSPVRLMMLHLPDTAPAALRTELLTAVGLAFFLSVTGIAVFWTTARLLGWPVRKAAFNVWTNLPLFDPTAGGDVLYRLRRDGHVNVALGCLVYFLIPAGLELANESGWQLSLITPLPRVIMLSAWAFLPAALVMRGIALQRVAMLIDEKRRRTYAQTDVLASVL